MSDATAADSPQAVEVNCRNCRHTLKGEKADVHGWCAACRRVVVRRSSRLALLPALLVAALYVWLMSWAGLYDSTFLIVWIALGAALVWVAYKIARRVFFDVVRARGVAPPAS